MHSPLKKRRVQVTDAPRLRRWRCTETKVVHLFDSLQDTVRLDPLTLCRVPLVLTYEGPYGSIRKAAGGIPDVPGKDERARQRELPTPSTPVTCLTCLALL